MLFGSITKNPPPPLLQLYNDYNDYSDYKLLVCSCHKHFEHASSLCSEDTQRIHFLQQLSNVPQCHQKTHCKGYYYTSQNSKTRQRVGMHSMVRTPV